MTPHDSGAYRIAIASLGLALVVVLAGAAVAVSLGTKTTSKAGSISTGHVANDAKSNRDGPLKSMADSDSQTKTTSNSNNATSTSEDDPSPRGLYIIGGVLAGVLIGILLPFPWPKPDHADRVLIPGSNPRSTVAAAPVVAALVGVVAVLLAAVILLALLADGETVVSIVSALIGGTLLGLLVPTPTARQPW